MLLKTKQPFFSPIKGRCCTSFPVTVTIKSSLHCTITLIYYLLTCVFILSKLILLSQKLDGSRGTERPPTVKGVEQGSKYEKNIEKQRKRRAKVFLPFLILGKLQRFIKQKENNPNNLISLSLSTTW